MTVRLLLQDVAEGIRVLQTRDGVDLTDEQILEWVAKDAETALHPSCTCRLGTGDDSVIDPTTMGVHGLEGIRVVDASSMRYVTNANIHAPTVMLAEKGADLIMGNTPLEPINEAFYRRQAARAAKKSGPATAKV